MLDSEILDYIEKSNNLLQEQQSVIRKLAVANANQTVVILDQEDKLAELNNTIKTASTSKSNDLLSIEKAAKIIDKLYNAGLIKEADIEKSTEALTNDREFLFKLLDFLTDIISISNNASVKQGSASFNVNLLNDNNRNFKSKTQLEFERKNDQYLRQLGCLR